jgi:hypothetical protein
VRSRLPGPLAAAAILLALTARPVQAQLGCAGSACTVEVSLPVASVMRISLSSTGVSLGTPTGSDYQLGYRDVAGPAVTATIKANRAFQVQVVGTGATFQYAGSSTNPNKAASDLRWATSQAGLATTTNHMGTAGSLLNHGPGANVQASLYLRTLWDFTRDVPGTYSMPIRLTLSAP